MGVRSRYQANKTLKICIWVCLLFTAGCSSLVSAIATPAKTHFVGDQKIPFDFYYPSNWILLKRDDAALPSIVFNDPEKPTFDPIQNGYDAYGDISSFTIVQLNKSPDIPLKEYVAEQLQKYGYPNGITIHLEEETTIDGVPAIRFVFSSKHQIVKGGITEVIFLYFDDFSYQLSWTGLEEERDNDFGQAYDEIIRTMKIIR